MNPIEKLTEAKKCGERIPANSQTFHNKTKHPKELIKCEQCEFETKYQETLNKHLLTHIPKEPKDKTSYTCIYCEKYFFLFFLWMPSIITITKMNFFFQIILKMRIQNQCKSTTITFHFSENINKCISSKIVVQCLPPRYPSIPLILY